MNRTHGQQESRVHVYGSGRVFVVVPLAPSENGEWMEMQPVERVNIVLGRSVIAPLAQALREGKARSSAGLEDEADVWDGDGGRWWDHNLLCVRISWSPAHVTFAPRAGARGEPETGELMEIMPGNLSETKIATRLVEYLGQRLEAA
jgi:hypothetical protein